MLTDDEYARILSHLKAARESLRLARHFAQNDQETWDMLDETQISVAASIQCVDEFRSEDKE